MPNGYYLPYIAESEKPYWNFGFGRINQKPDGTIPGGGILYLQRPPDDLGSHQSAYLNGVGRVIVKMGGFRPAPATVSNS
ncbi:MAG TPA: hypothetical protein VKQ89_01520 [Candidatus Angelobacter sp.]|nr:hypothetical protein [Candidatus Angelobacter sp.]